MFLSPAAVGEVAELVGIWPGSLLTAFWASFMFLGEVPWAIGGDLEESRELFLYPTPTVFESNFGKFFPERTLCVWSEQWRKGKKGGRPVAQQLQLLRWQTGLPAFPLPMRGLKSVGRASALAKEFCLDDVWPGRTRGLANSFSTWSSSCMLAFGLSLEAGGG